MVGVAAPPSCSDASTLTIQGVGKAYPTADGAVTSAIEGLSLTVNAGELVSLIGPSGCGKSTLLRMIAGLEAPTAGVLKIGSEPVTQANAHCGLMFQDHNLFPWLTVRRNVQAGLVIRGVLQNQLHEVDEFLRLMGLEAFADVYPHQLSGGMAQRAALARALINHPRLLLLDEPLGALDQFTRMRMQDELLRVWQSRGTTMLLVTHDIDEALYMSDRIAMMTVRPGRIDHVIEVPIPRPRLRTDPKFLELRAEIMLQLHLDGAAHGDGATDSNCG